ncbi:MAG: Phosphoenolpyruvate-protein phosphotransferase [Chlamydiia bacterium]|nr:Phosphoenolpyruvate-protein phosphotransferase [Chlamydiia bacterium]MCH9616099.1 Phosphoenolpyruvate-protein phosphotransferase [Chlamydiia bacterium]MCH9629478.1 Phosphoenolpyruvate-protein phosphotransferase [Chlamydiia bacterium]
MSSKTSSENILQGVPVSDGVAIGRLYCLLPSNEEIPEFSITATDVEREIDRYRRAVHSSKRDLCDLQSFLAKEGSTEAVTIIDTHIQMLDDPLMTTVVEDQIRDMQQNTEAVFRSVIGEYEKQFSRVGDDFFKERLLDVKDLSKRILNYLYPQRHSMPAVPKGSVLYAEELVPSDTAEAAHANVCAFLSEVGGSTSHAALIARAKNIPFVAGIDFASIDDGSEVIVDGEQGKVIVNPSEETKEAYLTLLEKLKNTELFDDESAQKPALTTDDTAIEIFANVDIVDELSDLKRYGAEGVGLFRTEFLFLHKPLHEFTAAEQTAVYQNVLEQTGDLPVTFRLFDVGGDKGRNEAHSEPNPAMGHRAIRYLLQEKDILETQLRALLSATKDHIRILIPLVTSSFEVEETRRLIELLIREIGYEGTYELGVMIETPAAALIIDQLVEITDFFSIGTNDLIQFLLAADRANHAVRELHQPTHPAVIRTLKFIVDSARPHGTPINLCGEIASNPLFTPLLIGLGLRKLSLPSRYIPQVKEMTRKISVVECESLIEKALSCTSGGAIHRLLIENYT